VGLLKPSGSFESFAPGLHQVLQLTAKNGVGQQTLDLVPRNRHQNKPGVVSQGPKVGVKLPPHCVSGMIPRPARIQGKFRQGIKSLNVRRQHVVKLAADLGLAVHDISWTGKTKVSASY